MTSIAIIAVSAVVMGILYFIITERKHSRLKEQNKEKDIRDAEAKLIEARRKYPQDILLHAMLSDNLKRLRKQ